MHTMERSLKMGSRRKTRFTGWLVVGLATAALTAPVAQADDWFRYAAPVEGSGQVLRPDDRAGIRGPGAVNSVGAENFLAHGLRPDDRAGIRGVGSVSNEPMLVRVTGDGFSWGDAGIGAASALALALLAGTSVLLLRRGRHGQLSST
jgi:hypothetical protein